MGHVREHLLPACALGRVFFLTFRLRLKHQLLPGPQSAGFWTRTSYQWLSWFSGLCTETGTTRSAFLGLQDPADRGTTQPPSSMSLFHTHLLPPHPHQHTHPLLILFLWKTQTNTLPLTWQRRRGKKASRSLKNRMKKKARRWEQINGEGHKRVALKGKGGQRNEDCEVDQMA